SLAYSCPDQRLRDPHALRSFPTRRSSDLDVVACNFTRKAFQEGAWTDLTMHARGLFNDEAEEKIVARGYEKFFHIGEEPGRERRDRKSTRLNSSHVSISYAVFCLEKKNRH